MLFRSDRGNTQNFNIPSAEQLHKLHAPYFKRMDDHIRDLNQKIGKQAVFVVPAGQAVIALREKVIAGKVPGIQQQSDLFKDSLGHGKAPLQTLVVYCNYAVAYRRCPVGLPMQLSLMRDYNNPELNRMLQEIAWDAVTHHPMSGVVPQSAASK